MRYVLLPVLPQRAPSLAVLPQRQGQPARRLPPGSQPPRRHSPGFPHRQSSDEILSPGIGGICLAGPALPIKAAEVQSTISDLVNAAVKASLFEDAEDLAAFEERASEPDLPFEDVLKDLKKRGKL